MSSILKSFSVNFREVFLSFPEREYVQPSYFEFFDNDTRTVAIIGLGKRTEVLVTASKGNELDGSPEDYDKANSPNGRFFEFSSYPIDPTTVEVYRGPGATVKIDSTQYCVDETNGYLVLYYPLQKGEKLVIRYVSFSDINVPRLFTAQQAQQLYNVYGSPSSTNSLSAGAEIAFANGAPRILAVQGDHTLSDPYWAKAYEALGNSQVYVVVPMHGENYASKVALGISHVNTMSETANRKERVIIFGETTDIPRSSIDDYHLEERAMYVIADKATTVIAGETQIAEGGYLAAAVAGVFTKAEYIAEPITKKAITRITLNWNNKQLYSESELKQYLANGIIVLTQQTPVIYQGVMTLASGNPVEQEPSIWKIRDIIAIGIRSYTENSFVGKALTVQLQENIAKGVRKFLDQQIDQHLITKYSGVRVEVDPLEPRQVDINFDVEPVFPLNGITLRINVVSKL